MTAQAYALSAAESTCEPFEIGSVQWLRQDESVQAGVWTSSPEQQPGVYEARCEMNETAMILEGRVRVDIVDGPTVELSVGDSASFVKGTIGRWSILEPVEGILRLQLSRPWPPGSSERIRADDSRVAAARLAVTPTCTMARRSRSGPAGGRS
jgi:uncharacterized cupin superfamily protein